MKLVVTIFEPSPAAAIEAIRGLTQDHDMVELRVDPFGAIDFAAVRAATAKPVIVTNRGGAPVDFEAAYGVGIDFVDVELGHDPGPRRDRVVLSHHDYDGMPDVDALLREMHALRCAHTKLAVTPRNYEENERLLASVEDRRPRLSEHATEADRRGRLSSTSVIGMGERGLYARIAAPFLGSELQFVAVDDAHVAAPGQLTLEHALAIYGANREQLHADKLFAIVGNPAAQSRSPLIHNPIFRERGVAAAYTIASFATFNEIAEPFARRDRFAPIGMSVTAPFKEEAFAFAERLNADVAENARDAGAVNTLAWVGGRIVADNTDVDGFEALIGTPKKAAIIGAGGTARAARVALARRGIPFAIYNRTPREGALPLDALQAFDGDLVIDTLPPGANVTLPNVATIRAAYKGAMNDLLRAQAVRQSAIFLEACR
jgi:3-dehydroquinate dehydratase